MLEPIAKISFSANPEPIKPIKPLDNYTPSAGLSMTSTLKNDVFQNSSTPTKSLSPRMTYQTAVADQNRIAGEVTQRTLNTAAAFMGVQQRNDDSAKRQLDVVV